MNFRMSLEPKIFLQQEAARATEGGAGVGVPVGSMGEEANS